MESLKSGVSSLGGIPRLSKHMVGIADWLTDQELPQAAFAFRTKTSAGDADTCQLTCDGKGKAANVAPGIFGLPVPSPKVMTAEDCNRLVPVVQFEFEYKATFSWVIPAGIPEGNETAERKYVPCVVPSWHGVIQVVPASLAGVNGPLADGIAISANSAPSKE